MICTGRVAQENRSAPHRPQPLSELRAAEANLDVGRQEEAQTLELHRRGLGLVGKNVTRDTGSGRGGAGGVGIATSLLLLVDASFSVDDSARILGLICILAMFSAMKPCEGHFAQRIRIQCSRQPR